jgi:hypothetical protein
MMNVVVKPRIELLFQDVEDPFLQDLEEIEYNNYTEETEENVQGKYVIQKLQDFIMILFPYLFIIQTSFIYTNVKLDATLLILHTLIYGTIITINQLYNKNIGHYWIFVLVTSFILPYSHLIILYVIPFTIELMFNKKNYIINILVEKYDIILGNHIFWSFITWILLIVYSQN